MTLASSAHPEQLSEIGASYRDPSGFVYRRDGKLYRQVNRRYEADYRRLIDSGLYADLTGDGLLIRHRETDLGLAATPDALAVLEPEVISTLSYPYEWSFSGLKDAALLTLEIAKRALDHGMVLKDATAYNVQFQTTLERASGPVFIDTLSFVTYVEGEPWIAYGQFCRHFLAPLALMALVDIRLGSLQSTYRDGIPLDLASRLLPKSLLRPGLLAHIHGHAKSEAQSGAATVASRGPVKVSKLSLYGLIDHLKDTVKHLKWEPKGTVWADYYAGTNYSDEAMGAKQDLVRAFLGDIAPGSRCWDLGANDGSFSRLAVELELETVGWDVDQGAIEKAYSRYRDQGGALPLLLDLTNPSGPGGWANSEQSSFTARGPVDVALALALIHHLAIGSNVTLAKVAEYMASLTRYLVIEFVPKQDSQVQRLLRSREDIFSGYSEEGFEAAFGVWFEIKHKAPVPGTVRTLYGLSRKA